LILSVKGNVVRRRLGAVVLALGLVATAAHAQPERAPVRVDAAGLRAMLAALGYPSRESGNESGVELEIVLRPPDGRAITTRVTLSKDGAIVWLVAWLKSVPPGRTISGNAILGMLAENDAIGPMHFSYNDSRRWFFLNKPVVNQDLSADRLRAELAHLGSTVARTEALWDPDRWR
jgi:hypothetical protein